MCAESSDPRPPHPTGPIHEPAPARADDGVVPPASEEYVLELDQEAFDLLCDIQELLGDEAPPGGLQGIIRMSLECAIETELASRRRFTSDARGRRLVRRAAGVRKYL